MRNDKSQELDVPVGPKPLAAVRNAFLASAQISEMDAAAMSLEHILAVANVEAGVTLKDFVAMLSDPAATPPPPLLDFLRQPGSITVRHLISVFVHSGGERLGAGNPDWAEGSYRRALEIYDAAGTLDPALRTALIDNILDCLVKQGSYAEAAKIVSGLIAANRGAAENFDPVKAWLMLARLHTFQGDAGKARGILDELARSMDEPGAKDASMRILRGLGEAFLEIGDSERAHQILVRADKLQEARKDKERGGSPRLKLLVGRALDALGKHDEAARLYKKAAAMSKSSSGGNDLRGLELELLAGKNALRRKDGKTARTNLKEAVLQTIVATKGNDFTKSDNATLQFADYLHLLANDPKSVEGVDEGFRVGHWMLHSRALLDITRMERRGRLDEGGSAERLRALQDLHIARRDLRRRLASGALIETPETPGLRASMKRSGIMNM